MELYGIVEDLPLFAGDHLLADISPLDDELPGQEQDLLHDGQSFYDVNAHKSFSEYVSSPEMAAIDEINNTAATTLSKPTIKRLDSYGYETINVEDLLQNVSTLLDTSISSHDVSSVGNTTITINISNIDEDEVLVPSNQMQSEAFEALSSCNFNVDDLLINKSEYSAALSPVSPEDIENILSSGPSSPTNYISGGPSSPYNDISEADNTLPSSGVNASFDYTESFGALSPSIDYSSSHEDYSEDSIISWKDELDLQKLIPASGIPSVKSEFKQRPARQRCKKESPYSPIKSRPYTRINQEHCRKPADSKQQRKKQQNKDAALRYRHKKREEKMNASQECDALEEKNKALLDQVDSMTREIQYLKDLLKEVTKARKLSSKAESSKG